MNRREKTGFDGFMASKIDGLEAERHRNRNIVFQSAVKEVKGKDMANIMVSQIHEDSEEVEKFTNNVEIKKADPRVEILNLAFRSEANKDEGIKRIKLTLGPSNFVDPLVIHGAMTL